MKHITLFLFLLLSITISTFHSQQLFLETGSCSSSFDYLNSAGEPLDNLQSKSQNVMQMGCRIPGFKDFLSYTFTVSYTGYGAIGSDSLYVNYMEWDLNYIQFHAGLDVRALSWGPNELVFKVNSSFGYLIQGTQVLNNSVFDLVGKEEFHNTLFSLVMGVSVNRQVTEDLTIYMQFANGIGDPLGVKRTDLEERLRLKSRCVSLGVLMQINRDKS